MEEYKMKPKEILSDVEFKKVVQKGVALIDFNAPWCGPCRLQEPILEKIAEAFNGTVMIGAVNVDRHMDIASSYGIQSIPTIIIFKNRKEVKRFIGLQPESMLTGILNKLTK
jgi:thioredoxin 1